MHSVALRVGGRYYLKRTIGSLGIALFVILSSGTLVSLALALEDHLSRENIFRDRKNVYVVLGRWTIDNDESLSRRVPCGLAEAAGELPTDVLEVGRAHPTRDVAVRHRAELKELDQRDGLWLVDSGFLRMLSYSSPDVETAILSGGGLIAPRNGTVWAIARESGDWTVELASLGYATIVAEVNRSQFGYTHLPNVTLAHEESPMAARYLSTAGPRPSCYVYLRLRDDRTTRVEEQLNQAVARLGMGPRGGKYSVELEPLMRMGSLRGLHGIQRAQRPEVWLFLIAAVLSGLFGLVFASESLRHVQQYRHLRVQRAAGVTVAGAVASNTIAVLMLAPVLTLAGALSAPVALGSPHDLWWPHVLMVGGLVTLVGILVPAVFAHLIHVLLSRRGVGLLVVRCAMVFQLVLVVAVILSSVSILKGLSREMGRFDLFEPETLVIVELDHAAADAAGRRLQSRFQSNPAVVASSRSSFTPLAGSPAVRLSGQLDSAAIARSDYGFVRVDSQFERVWRLRSEDWASSPSQGRTGFFLNRSGRSATVGGLKPGVEVMLPGMMRKSPYHGVVADFPTIDALPYAAILFERSESPGHWLTIRMRRFGQAEALVSEIRENRHVHQVREAWVGSEVLDNAFSYQRRIRRSLILFLVLGCTVQAILVPLLIRLELNSRAVEIVVKRVVGGGLLQIVGGVMRRYLMGAALAGVLSAALILIVQGHPAFREFGVKWDTQLTFVAISLTSGLFLMVGLLVLAETRRLIQSTTTVLSA